ncbi:hypothetical protein [Algivirga pacifica]|uniref:hypothetical protein n=1 Tax=Algivirga pacifica TaxID=1162670 RepID=UPI0031EA3F55
MNYSFKLSTLFLSYIGLLSIFLLGSVLFQLLENKDEIYTQEKAIARRFLLTDFCFSTESRHTRHISMPEWIAPFQDFPAYHEHFPSSSFFKPNLVPVQEDKP